MLFELALVVLLIYVSVLCSFIKFGIIFSHFGKKIEQIVLFLLQCYRECFSVSTSYVQKEYILPSLGSHVCVWRPFSMASVWLMSLCLLSVFLTLGPFIVNTYSAILYSLSEIRYISNLRWHLVPFFPRVISFSYCFLIIGFGQMVWELSWGTFSPVAELSFRISRLKALFSMFCSWHQKAWHN